MEKPVTKTWSRAITEATNAPVCATVMAATGNASKELQVRYVGIDIGPDQERTSLAIVNFSHGITVEHSVTGIGDEYLQRIVASTDVRVTGLTAPLLPLVFRRVGIAQREVNITGRVDAIRRDLSVKYMVRATDRHVISRLAHLPPRINATAETRGTVANRARKILEVLSRAEIDVTGRTGKVIEVDPCVALDAWSAPYAGYVGYVGGADVAEVREMIVSYLASQLLLDPTELRARNAGQLNAFIAALVAFMSRHRRLAPIPVEHLDDAKREGWMAIPTSKSLVTVRDSLRSVAQSH